MQTRRWMCALLLSGILFAAGCEQNDEGCTKGYRPPDCVTAEPSVGIVRINVTINGMNPSVPVTVYLGTIDQNHPILSDTLTASTASYRLGNAEYSVKARYRANINGSLVTVYSIDGGMLSASRTEYCDGDCYGEGTLNLDAVAP